MRHTLAVLTLALTLAACAADPVLLPDAGPCGGACGAGTVCVEGACVAVDAGGPVDTGALDAGAVDSGPVDVGEDRPGADAGVDIGPCRPACGAGAECVGTGCRCIGSLRACGGACVDVASDAANCGACGRACADGQACIGSNCGCAPGRQTCAGSGLCGSDRATDLFNCGACGVRCSTQCIGGSCAPAPPPDAGCIRATQCGTGCFDLTTSDHCGACGVVCNASQQCGAGDGGRACVSRCSDPTPDWCWSGTSATGATRTNFCTDLAMDPYNCGGCGRERCVGRTHCAFGRCVPN